MRLYITTNFDEVAARFLAAEAATPGIIEAGMAPLGEAVKSSTVPIMAGHTPVRSGVLAGSTEGDMDVFGDGVEVMINQPAVNEEGVEYVQWVILGRGDVYPVTKKALAGPGFGPVMHAGPAAPNPYNEAAMEEASGPIEGAMDAAGLAMASTIIAVLG